MNKFLYIDVEWNQIRKRRSSKDEILEIGAISAWDEYIIERYFKYIKPLKPIKKRTQHLLGISDIDLKCGENIDSALLYLSHLWNDSDYVVIWSFDALDIVINACARSKIFINQSNVIILQKLFEEFLDNGSRISFENALMSYGALYDRIRMHNAGFDAECLKSLFDILCSKCKNIIFANDLKIIESKKAKKIHVSNCKYGLRIIETNRIEVPIYKVFQKEKCCKYCMIFRLQLALDESDSEEYEILKSIRRLKGKEVTSSQIDILMDYFKLKFEFRHNYILVTTDYSLWKIYYANGIVKKVEHQNYKYCDHKGFHRQKFSKKDMFSVLEYIANHDKNPHKKKIVREREQIYNRKVKKKRMQKERRRYREDNYEDWTNSY